MKLTDLPTPVKREMAGYREAEQAYSQAAIDDKAFRLWLAYYALTEAYDRTVCTAKSKRTGDALPADSREQGLIARHARRRYTELRSLANYYGIGSYLLVAMKERALRVSFYEASMLSEREQREFCAEEEGMERGGPSSEHPFEPL